MTLCPQHYMTNAPCGSWCMAARSALLELIAAYTAEWPQYRQRLRLRVLPDITQRVPVERTTVRQCAGCNEPLPAWTSRSVRFHHDCRPVRRAIRERTAVG